MTQHEDSVRLGHMLEAALKAREFAGEKTSAELARDERSAHATVRMLEIVGEAARLISGEFRSAHPEIAWPQIIALRNRLAHAYTDVDLDVLAGIISDDLPPLIAHLERVLSDSGG